MSVSTTTLLKRTKKSATVLQDSTLKSQSPLRHRARQRVLNSSRLHCDGCRPLTSFLGVRGRRLQDLLNTLFDDLSSLTDGQPAYTKADAVPLQADLVALPEAPHRVSVPNFPPKADMLLPEVDWGPRYARTSCRMKTRHNPQYPWLIKRMHSAGMLRWTLNPEAVSDVFVVPKKTKQRLIINMKATNRIFRPPPHVLLPNASHLTRLRFQASARVFVAKTDLSNFYHCLELPDWMIPFTAIPPLEREELLALGIPPSELPPPALQGGAQLIYPASASLPMGFSWSVAIAQAFHLHVLYSDRALDPKGSVLTPCPSRSRTLHAIYIDDVLLFGSDKEAVQAALDKSLAAYAKYGLSVAPSKIVRVTEEPVNMLGFRFCPRRRTFEPEAGKLLALMSRTEKILSARVVSGRDLSSLLGGWAWFLLLRRPAFTVLNSVYAFVRRHDTSVGRLTWTARVELKSLIALAPLIRFRLRPFSTTVLASDASLMAGAICAAGVPASAFPYLNLRESRGLVPVPEHWPSLKDTLKWRHLNTFRWRHLQHINTLEAHAALQAITWFASGRHATDKSLFCLIDNTVVTAILRKGRTSAKSLRSVFFKITATLLTMGLDLHPIWVPTNEQPADEGSRTLPTNHVVL
jgi:hypothetical protein